ncbi:MAG TPA: signal peptidase I [Verrucomicrobiota bacterium]|nr:signal peptidase I [Verrucomicrobiota bacterium]HNU51971.1 signal peptidase I [Verrucomicrobiota bacterium]
MRAANSHAPPIRSLWLRLIVGKNPRVTLIRAAILGLACWLLFRHGLLPVRITGISMEPTYRNRSINLVNRFPYLYRQPRRGEVIAIQTTGPSVMYMKRILGLPGEQVELRHGKLFINNDLLPEPYVHGDEPWDFPRRTLKPDEYLVLGDNRSMPIESHAGGVIQRWRIVGPVLW